MVETPAGSGADQTGVMRRLALLFALCIILIIVLADLGFLNRVLRVVNDVPHFDKVLHFLLIGGLTYLVCFGLIETFPNRNPNWIILFVVVALGVVFTLEEISQGSIPWRDSSPRDLAANYAGILFFGFLGWLRVRRRATKT